MKKFLALVLVLMLAAAVLSAMAEDTIKLGMIGPLTGGAAVYGQSVANGAQIAVDEINAAGGVNGFMLELNAQDDTHDAEKSVNAYNTIMDWGAQAILGTVTTAPCIAVADIAFEERVFLLTPSASALSVNEGKDNVYRICFNDPAQGSASAEYISAHALAAKVGVIYNNADSYSTGIYQTFAAKAPELGLEVVAVETFTDDTTDFTVQVNSMKNAGAELVFLPIYYTPASMILQVAKSIDYAPKFFGVDGMDGILTIEGFDTSLAEGVMLLTPFSADAADEKTENVGATYQAKFGEVPTQFAADGYDGIYAFAAAIEAASITPAMGYEDVCEALIAAVQGITDEGLTGTMTWDAAGEVSKTPAAVVIENGVYVGAVD